MNLSSETLINNTEKCKEPSVELGSDISLTNTCTDRSEIRDLIVELESSTSEANIQVILSHFEDLTLEEAIAVVREAIRDHADDPCLPHDKLDQLKSLLEPSVHDKDPPEWVHRVKLEAFFIRDWSIYPEVRAVTTPIEEPGEICETLRVYVIGIIWACAGSCFDTFFHFRFPSISISMGAIQLLILACGRAWALLVPDWKMPIWKGVSVRLSPGKWTFKEQMLTTLTVSVSLGSPYASHAIAAQYNQNFFGLEDAGNFGYMIMMILSSAFMGFGIAGLMRVFLVYREQCVWYSVLPTIAFNRAIVEKEKRISINGWKLLRMELFWVAAIAVFCWYWVTNFLFNALSYFDWPAWIAPNNVDLQAMTGMITGLGVNPWPTFDWNIAERGAMIAPLYATLNHFVGVIISLVAIVIVWYTNVRFTGHFPINSNNLFSNDGTAFQVRNIVDNNGILDPKKYQSYSLPFYSAGNLVTYGSYFLFYPAMFVFAMLNYGKVILESFALFLKSVISPKKALANFDDRFTRAQRVNKEVPELWFLSILVASTGVAIATVKVYSFTETPAWTIFFGIGLASFFTIPFGLLYSVTNISMDINVLFELIIGYALPGNGNALMVSKVFSTNFLAQTDNYITNQKQIHYTGIPPRSLFRLQTLSVTIVSFVQAAILYWQLHGGVHDLCNPLNRQKFTCQGVRTYFNAAVIWGTIGPKRIFDFLYPSIKYTFLIGALYPVPFWLVRRFYPNKGGSRLLRNVNEILWIVGALGSWAPYNMSYAIPNLYIGLFFNGFVRSKFPSWWKKYNYILYVALGVVVAYSSLIMFFSTNYRHEVSLDWWGNNVMYNTKDGDGTAARLVVAPGTIFGPPRGSLP